MRVLPTLVLAGSLGLAACAVPATGPVHKGTPSRAPVVTVAASPVPPGASPAALASPAGPVEAAAGLTGKVKAPAALIQAAGIISDNGGGIISDNGAGVVSNNGAGVVSSNGGRYRLAALAAQQPVAGVRVALVDGAGKPVVGTDGRPIEAVTGPDGSYRFPPGLPAHGLRVVAALGKLAPLQALAPAGRTATTVDVDLVSTLTTVYILDQYVTPQAIDHQVVLDRLPPDVEATTRAKASAALDAGAVPVPDDLTSAKVQAAVASLRAKDAALDQQLEVVKALLVVAGQSDLGNGLLGTSVSFPGIGQLAAGPGGEVYFVTFDNRIWRLDADGHVRTVVGRGQGRYDLALEGKRATDVGIFSVVGLAVDAQGRLLFLEEPEGYKEVDLAGLPEDAVANGSRLSRLEADGTIHELFPMPKAPDAIWGATIFAAGQGIDMFGAQGDAYHLEEDKQTSIPGYGAVDGLYSCGRDAAGNLYVIVNDYSGATPPKTKLRRIAPGGQGQDLVDAAAEHLLGLSVVQDGRPLRLTADRKLLLDTAVVATDVASDLGLGGTALALPSGDVVFTATQRAGGLYRAHAGKAALVAGNGGQATGGAHDATFQGPTGLLELADGSLLVCDREGNQVVRVTTAGQVEPFAGTGTAGTAGRPGPAVKAQLDGPTSLRLGADGTIYIFGQNGKPPVAVDPAGAMRELAITGDELVDLLPLPDGTLLTYMFSSGGPRRYDLGRFDPATGKTSSIQTFVAPGVETPETPNDWNLVPAPGGGVYLLGNYGLRKWTAAGGLQVLATFPEPTDEERIGQQTVSIDAKGRLLYAVRQGVRRFDPATGKTEALAGPGTKILAGSGVDDSLEDAACPAIARNGDLLILDGGHRQVKRVPAKDVAP